MRIISALCEISHCLWTQRSKPPAFKLRLAAKDARLALDAARAQGLDLPLVETIAHRLTAGAKTHGNEDMSATFLTSKRGKGGA